MDCGHETEIAKLNEQIAKLKGELKEMTALYEHVHKSYQRTLEERRKRRLKPRWTTSR